ncbi:MULTISPECIES: glycosyltransferase family 4 protein [Pseudomonas]|uniref:glycosyltransferase family 4 protein n=1 Tax=Pseudomonas TaxID=286 RepID=UPI001CF0C11D|nr:MULTISPECIES: glycosyltransferase family 4 protein [Pseudomonas]UCL86765.1 glycosyltransferase family 4 protein [Pseudomonas sp. HS-18]WEW98889.1 glycosyltransferase family 4 protein [Pseudomonas nitroreducens]
MKLLLIHQNFPGQFLHLAHGLLKDSRCQLLAIARDTARGVPGVRTLRYSPSRAVSPQIHHYLYTVEDAVLHGQQVARLLLQLRGTGYRPDVILAHPGWGETLYAKDVYPDVPLMHFCEYYGAMEGSDINFDPEFPSSFDECARSRTRNALHLLNLEHCDLGISPTPWQRGLHPLAYREKIQVAHEGIPLDMLRPDPRGSLRLPSGQVLRAGDPVVTYVARNLEPYRGFHIFMRALPQILDRHPRAQVLILGGDEVSYGMPPQGAPNWRTRMLEEVRLDRSRVHFLGKVPYATYVKALQVSCAHVYLTYPFVLSWSMLEAMACGCLLVASDTAPVREVVRDRENGYLVDFFAVDDLAERVLEVLHNPSAHAGLRQMARLTAQRFDTRSGVSAYRRLLEMAMDPARAQG